MTKRRVGLAGVMIVVALLAAAGLFRMSGFWPGPSLPPGATALRLSTKPAGPFPGYCPGEITVPPARIVVVGDALELVPEAGGDRYMTRFAVWLPPDRAQACLAAVSNTAGSLGLHTRVESESG